MANWFKKLTRRSNKAQKDLWYNLSLLRAVTTGTFFRLPNSDITKTINDIETQINTMRGLATDPQIAMALSYYATDATTKNSNGDIIWAVPLSPDTKEVADIVNAKLKQWDVNKYARDHILELATIGNLYLPTTQMYRLEGEGQNTQKLYSLDGNSQRDDSYEIVPSYKIPPETVLHAWYQGKPNGYIYQDADSQYVIKYPEEAIIHFSLGGLLGDYSIVGKDSTGNEIEFDVQFAEPLLAQAVQPTQTLSLIEDADILSSLTRIVRFINVECNNAEEEEIQATLTEVKNLIEQQLSINTSTGNVQSYVNPQSPNNLIFVPRINGQDPISVTDLNMQPTSEADNSLREYYQNKKLSVLGIPKEALNFSGAEGLGNAGSVMSQRSALYANILGRLETAYTEGWRSGINMYLDQHGMSGMIDQYKLQMNPIVTELSQTLFDKRDAAIGQAASIVELLGSLGVTQPDQYKSAITELLQEVLPTTGTAVNSWTMNLTNNQAGGEEDAF